MQRIRLSTAILLAAIAIGPNLARAQYFFEADLSSSEVYPPTESEGTGWVVANLWSLFDCEEGGELWVYGFGRDLVGFPQAIVLARGVAGEGSEAIHSLAWHADETGFAITDTTLVLNRDECYELMRESLHVLVSTDSFPTGEIAGQLLQRLDPVLTVTWGAIRATYR